MQSSYRTSSRTRTSACEHADADPASAGAVQRLVADMHPHLEVEVLPGGQPHYAYLAGVE